MAIEKLIKVTYHDFKLNEIIDPEKFDQNNKDLVEKIDEIVDTINSQETDSEEINIKIDEAIDTANEAKELAEQANTKANEAIDTANGIESIAVEAKTIAQTTESNFNNMSDEIYDWKEEVDNNIEEMQNIIDEAVKGDANIEVGQAHVSDAKGKTFETIKERFEETEEDVQNIQGYITEAIGDLAADQYYTETLVNLHLDDGAQHAKTARFVIGTSTAGWTTKDCDYLCDGTDDQVEINNAITALSASGGEIIILNGTYNITAKINVNKNNVSIRGNGNATILKRMWNSSSAEGVITLTSVECCRVRNLQIDGNKANYVSNNIGIYLDSSSNNTITGNTCNNNSNIGIYLDSSNNNTIIGNTCNYNSGVGIRLDSSNNNTITGNTCNNNIYGIHLNSSSNENTVTGNTCSSSNYGIYLSSSSNNTVTGNICNSSSTGIYLNSSSNNTVTGNTCNNNSNNGIYLNSSSNNTITGNICNSNNICIHLSVSSNENTITGNTCNNNGNIGIYLNLSSNNTITGNTCNNNNNGIRLNVSDNNIVTGNTCIRGTGQTSDYTSNQYTILLNSSSNNYNLISSNNCIGKAVVVGGGTGNSVWGNKFDNTDDLP